MEGLYDNTKPRANAEGTEFTFALPLGEWSLPFIVLRGFARYVDWLFSHPPKSSGLKLPIATVCASGQEFAEPLTVTNPGRKGIYRAIPVSVWHDATWVKLPKKQDAKVGFRSVNDDRALSQAYEQKFTAGWELYKKSTGNKADGVILRDYELLVRNLAR